MSDALEAAIRVGATPGPQPVNRRLFGKFTEHIHRNVYGGAWAQIVRNPELAGPTVWPKPQELRRRLREAATTFALPGLPESETPWWIADGARWITPVHLPAHRTTDYRLTLRLRSAGPLEVSLRVAGGAVWARTRLEAGEGWVTREATLHGGAAPEPGSPFWLVIEGAAELRRCLLFPADHLDGWDPDVVRFMREARLPLLRFPGGNFVSGYRWRDGVGPVEQRPAKPNPAWPEAEWNHVGTDEWLRLCALVGCEALICVNAGDGTAQEAAQWVEYCNGGVDTPCGAERARNGHPQPYGVCLWEVGNELYGAWQIGSTDARAYGARYLAFAEAMRARDGGIQLIANGDSEEWNRGVVAVAGSEVRTLSHHCLYGGYGADLDPQRVYLEHMAFPPAYRRLWDELARPMREAGLRPRLAITEQQIFTHRPELPTNATLTEALWTASLLNEALRAGDLIELWTHSALCNHGGGLRKEREIVYAQPAWWATHLYGSLAGGFHPVEVSVDSPRFTADPVRLRVAQDAPYLDAVGMAVPGGDAVALFLVNRHPDRAVRVRVSMAGGVYRRAEALTLTGASFMAQNSWEEPDAVRPVATEIEWKDGPTQVVVPACALMRLHLSR